MKITTLAAMLREHGLQSISVSVQGDTLRFSRRPTADSDGLQTHRFVYDDSQVEIGDFLKSFIPASDAEQATKAGIARIQEESND